MRFAVKSSSSIWLLLLLLALFATAIAGYRARRHSEDPRQVLLHGIQSLQRSSGLYQHMTISERVVRSVGRDVIWDYVDHKADLDDPELWLAAAALREGDDRFLPIVSSILRRAPDILREYARYSIEKRNATTRNAQLR
jgi:hypothetical protein